MADPAPPLPRPITRLPTAVVNRIAAGEIIQRPANALKELIENCLDAGATTIKVTVNQGGTKLLQIQDNGSGIRKADLAILCERFTTSKIKAFDDLQSLNTYGFRGEALASISHVAHLSVTTKTHDDACAWKASYFDGVLVPVKPGGDAAPSPCAGNNGTLIVVEDLFFNTPTRLKSLKSSSDEYARIVGVLQSYAIHNSGVSITCKKSTGTTLDVNTAIGSSVLENIGQRYGESLRKELIKMEMEDAALGFKASGWFSGANFTAKKGTFLFFINHRLVDCTALKRAFEAFYETLLPKNAHPFIYLALEVDPTKLDVNIHPTKQEVHLMDSDDIVEVVCESLGKVLAAGSESRSYKVQTLLPGVKKPDHPPPPAFTTATNSNGSKPNSKSKIAPNKLVRTDVNLRTLDTMFASTQVIELAAQAGTEGVDGEERPRKRRKDGRDEPFLELLAAEPGLRGGKILQSECRLGSVQALRQEVADRAHSGLDAVVKNHIFVGVADLGSSLSMIQHQTKLYLVNHSSLSEELFYQLGLRQFGRFLRIKLKPAPSLRDLVALAVGEQRDAIGASGLSPGAIVDRICSQLTESRAMLDEYFSFQITEDGTIDSIPLLLPGYTPNINRLPLFLVRIGVEVDWTDEKACFESFLRELAYLYIPYSILAPRSSPTDEEVSSAEKHRLKNSIFPAIKSYLVPGEQLVKHDFVQVTSLESLYRVFERC